VRLNLSQVNLSSMLQGGGKDVRGRGCSLPVGRPGCRRGSAAPGKAACWTASTGRGAQPARTLVTETPGAQEHQARVRDLEECLRACMLPGPTRMASIPLQPCAIATDMHQQPLS